MIIKEFFIKRYGPLQDKGYTLSNNFNLILGKNEDGKTLTIDALVKLLLGRNIKDFERIDRVEENPEGYVIIEGEDGEEIKLPEKGNLTKLAQLTPSECRNVFVIRNSDLSIFRESEFYTDVTDRLTGLRTTEISRIKEMLREMGKMTPSGTFRDTKDEKLKTRIESAENLISDIESLAEKIVALGGKQRMPVREYYPGEKPYRMVYCEDPFGNIIELYSHSYELTYSAGAYQDATV